MKIVLKARSCGLTTQSVEAIDNYTPENTRLMRPGGCFVPERFKHLKWHVLKVEYPTGIMWERAEWVNDPENGPTEGGHWVRWGKTGDFPSLCKADYFAPAVDQDPPYAELPWEERFEAYNHAESD